MDYERFVAGESKDAGNLLREMEDNERRYLQGIVDDRYDSFVERVADGRDLSEDQIRDTEARLYVGEDAHDIGLVDELGTGDAAEAYLADAVGHDVETHELEPPRGLMMRLRSATASVSYAFGAGLGATFGDGDGTNLRLR